MDSGLLIPIVAIFHRLILVTHSINKFFTQLINGTVWKCLSVIHFDLFEFLHELFHKFNGLRTVFAFLRHMAHKPYLIVDLDLRNQHYYIITVISFILFTCFTVTADHFTQPPEN